jgi:hypothetical protein
MPSLAVSLVLCRRAVSARAEPLLASLIAAAAGAGLIAVDALGGDAPAHLYRTELLREGVYGWDNVWYGGHYPFVTYSLLYYLPAALVGNVPLVLAASVVSATLFASLAVRQWRGAARWPARAFAVLAVGPLLTGTYSYALGFTALLGTLWALEAGHTWLALVCAALTLGFSPLAFILLCLALLAVFVTRRRLSRQGVLLVLALAALGGLELALLRLFAADGVYPFAGVQLLATVALCASGAALALRAPQGRLLAALLAVWGVACVLAFLVPTAVGGNLTRPRFAAFPLVLLAALLARFRPRWLAALALSFAAAYNLAPYRTKLPAAISARSDEADHWTPALSFLKGRLHPNHRVEVVPTAAHWEAYYVPRAGFALARGWYRQADRAQNEVLYRDRLAPPQYRAWLRRWGVRYVVLPELKLDTRGAEAEAALLRSRTSGLARVHRSRDWSIYELPGATPILTGPAPAGIKALEPSRIVGWTDGTGRFRLRVRYTPYWQVRTGHLCLARASDGLTLLTVGRPGPFRLTFPQSPRELLAASLGRDERDCAIEGVTPS